jgi:hypothetical protein
MQEDVSHLVGMGFPLLLDEIILEKDPVDGVMGGMGIPTGSSIPGRRLRKPGGRGSRFHDRSPSAVSRIPILRYDVGVQEPVYQLMILCRGTWKSLQSCGRTLVEELSIDSFDIPVG